MRLRTTKKYQYRNGNDRKFWGCSRFPDCKAAHGAHPDGSPMGTPADTETKALRQQVHAVFDPLCKKAGLTRSESYRFLRHVMQMSGDDAHIAKFDKATCELAIERLATWKASDVVEWWRQLPVSKNRPEPLSP